MSTYGRMEGTTDIRGVPTHLRKAPESKRVTKADCIKDLRKMVTRLEARVLWLEDQQRQQKGSRK